jgi:hypothetical protein
MVKTKDGMSKHLRWLTTPVMSLAVALFLLLASSGVAQALMLEMSLEELADGADAIVVGTVISTSSRWDADHISIYTEVVVSVEERLKGSVGGDTVTVVVPGGAVGETAQWVSDTPVFEMGENAVLFLKELPGEGVFQIRLQDAPLPLPSFLVHGQFQGKLEIRDGKVGALPVAELKRQVDEIVMEEGSFSSPVRTDSSHAAVVQPAYVYGGLKWFGTSPNVTYEVNASNTDRNTAVQNAATTWSIAGAKFGFTYGGTHSRDGNALANGVNEVVWYDLGAGTVLAESTVWYLTSTGQIVEADIVFNTRYDWSTAAQTPSGNYDVQTVALHELGHWLRLGHSDVQQAVMWYQYKGTQRALHADDIAGITYIYGAVCSVSTPSTPSGSTSGQTNTSYTYSTGGATSTAGHSVQYRFDWGDGTLSSWSSSTSASKSWSSPGTYDVKAQARCATDNSVLSAWSPVRSVTIRVAPTTTTTPATNVTPGAATLNMSYTLGGYTPVAVRFAYKKSVDSAWTATSWVSKSSGSTHTTSLSGLDSNSGYDFRAELRYDSTVLQGDVLQFTTLRVPPTVTTSAASQLETDSATLNMNYTVGDYAPVEVRFGYKKAEGSEWTTTDWLSKSSAGTHSETLTGLERNTLYDFRAELRYDSTETQGDVFQFTTSDLVLYLQAGWNMVSVPLTLDPERDAPEQVFPGIVAIYTWNASSKSYTTPTVIDSFRGYWVAAMFSTPHAPICSSAAIAPGRRAVHFSPTSNLRAPGL